MKSGGVTTIKDIAREAGFSVSTVSRVIAGHPDVSAATATAVQAVIDRRHFMVNRNAANLKRLESKTILVVAKGRHNLLFASMLEYVQAKVQATGYTVATWYIDEDANEVAEAERLVSEVKPKGIVFLGGESENVASSANRVGPDCPAVVLTNSVAAAGRLGVSSVTTNDRAAGRLAVEHLLTRGHTRIGVIGGNPETSLISRNRQHGVMDALDTAGLPFDPRWYVATHYSLQSGYTAAGRLIDDAPNITAIYAMSDIMAIGVLQALHERSVGVPDDISLIGHDGIELASYVVPRLVTIRQPQELIATRGVNILMNHIDGNLTPVEQFEDVSIVAGESVRTL